MTCEGWLGCEDKITKNNWSRLGPPAPAERWSRCLNPPAIRGPWRRSRGLGGEIENGSRSNPQVGLTSAAVDVLVGPGLQAGKVPAQSRQAVEDGRLGRMQVGQAWFDLEKVLVTVGWQPRAHNCAAQEHRHTIHWMALEGEGASVEDRGRDS